MTDEKDKGWTPFRGGEIREISEDEDIRCSFCDSSIWDVDMVMGIEDKRICEDCISTGFGVMCNGFVHAIKDKRITTNQLEKISNHIQDILKVGQELKDKLIK